MSWSNNNNNDDDRDNHGNVKDLRNHRRRHYQNNGSEDDRMLFRQIFLALTQRLETSESLKQLANSGTYSKDPSYETERKELMSINQIGLQEGILAGLLTFFILRRGPTFTNRLLSSAMRGRNNNNNNSTNAFVQRAGGYQLDRPASSSSNNNNSSNSRSVLLWVLRLMKLGLDASVSLLVAASTSFYWTDEQAMLSKVSKLPMVEGRSVVSDEFCPVVLEQLQKGVNTSSYATIHSSPPPTTTSSSSLRSRNGGPSAYMHHVYNFAHHCRQRRAYQHDLLQQQGEESPLPQLQQQQNEFPSGLQGDTVAAAALVPTSIEIPPPGVPMDYPVKENDNDDMNNNDGNDFFQEGNDGSMSYFGSNEPTFRDDDDGGGWAESMVSDQQENKGRRQR